MAFFTCEWPHKQKEIAIYASRPIDAQATGVINRLGHYRLKERPCFRRCYMHLKWAERVKLSVFFNMGSISVQ